MLPALRSKALPWLALLALAALRLVWLDAYPLDSDEAQHAHVAWAWSRGLLPYRDVFDNHGPLFGLLNAPWLALLGERADVLTWLRLAVQPWYFLALSAAWLAGRRLYGTGVAWAGTLAAALYPRFFMVTGQFRTDDLWAALWLAALAALLAGRHTRRRAVLAGLLAGAALCVSQKTVLLLAAALAAGALAWLRTGAPRWRDVAAFLAGLLALPLGFAAWFAAHGALAAAGYGLVGYNLAATGKEDDGWRLAGFFVLAPLALGLALWRLRRGGPRAAGRVFLALQGGLYLLAVLCLWPLVTRQDFLPAIPPLLLSLCGWLAGRPWAARAAWRAPAALAGALLLELAVLAAGEPPWQDALAGQRRELASVLRYSGPDDTVMDAKGAAIFRRRPYYPVIESMARMRFRRGLLPDTIAAELVRHRTMLAVRGGLPDLGDAFVARNYLPSAGDSRVRVAGLALPGGKDERRFDLRLPGDYTLVDGQAKVAASLDGGVPADHWTLARGEHRLAAPPGRPLMLVWSRAWAHGWRPAVPTPALAVAGVR
jgi:hypothetical protein